MFDSSRVFDRAGLKKIRFNLSYKRDWNLFRILNLCCCVRVNKVLGIFFIIIIIFVFIYKDILNHIVILI